MGDNYYQILKVSKGATQNQIKNAYKKLSLEYHPDKNKSVGAEEKFKTISNAYRVLIDETTRKIYDKYGEGGLKIHASQTAQTNDTNNSDTSQSNSGATTAQSSDMTWEPLIIAGLAGLAVFAYHMTTRRRNNN